MKRISLSWFAQLGAALQPVSKEPPYGRSVNDPHWRGKIIGSYSTLRTYLLQLLAAVDSGAFPFSIRSSYAHIVDVLQKIGEILDSDHSTLADNDFLAKASNIWLKATDLDTVLNSELSVQPTYFMFPKQAYDIETLLIDDTKLFSEECRGSFTEKEKYDIDQAAKCLVFEVPTAAAFHMLRATESVIRRYYAQVVGTLPAPKSRNWGVYLVQLRRCGGDAKVLAVLEEIKDLYRNPIIHPETQVEMEEALSLVGVAETAISAMIADLAKRIASRPAQRHRCRLWLRSRRLSLRPRFLHQLLKRSIK